MRQANTTYVNLRATLDDLDPFVEASKPVARKLRPYLARAAAVRARGGAHRARPAPARARTRARATTCSSSSAPTRRSRTSRWSRRAGAIDFGTGAKGRGPDARRVPRAGRGAGGSPPRSSPTGRPYTPDFVGWIDDFSHTGAYDALGSFSRAQTYVNAFTCDDGLPTGDLIPLERARRGVQGARQPAPGQALPGRRRGARRRRLQRLLRGGAAASSTASSPHRATGPTP